MYLAPSEISTLPFWFLSHLYPSGFRPWACDNFGRSISIDYDLKMQEMPPRNPYRLAPSAPAPAP